MMDESRLREKLAHIEALFAGAATDGERVAAAEARERILQRLRAAERESPPIEYKFTFDSPWSRKLFVALLRRYEIRPYRFRGQRYTTIMAMVSKRFVDETLWPEYQQLSSTLCTFLDEVTDRVIADSVHRDSSDAEERPQPLLQAPKR
jgi:hypothetical protein